MDVYDRLPEDLQRVVRRYFTVWQRLGFRYPPPLLEPRPECYYRHIRKRPKGGIWDPTYPSSFYFRRQDHLFQWHIWLQTMSETEDMWNIEIYPQWNTSKTGLAIPVIELEPWTRDPLDHLEFIDASLYGKNNMILLQFVVAREDPMSPPSRQFMAESIIRFVIRMANDIERYRRAR